MTELDNHCSGNMEDALPVYLFLQVFANLDVASHSSTQKSFRTGQCYALEDAVDLSS